jgi:uncharacterized protein (DUF2164 family)
MASVIMCLYYDGSYLVNTAQTKNCSDKLFTNIIKNIINKENDILISNGINMDSFYQHDLIYKLHKKHILEFINNHLGHYVLTDGINAGDNNYEKFYMIDIINTPSSFNKKYKNVLHIRLEDYVKYNMHLEVKRIIELLDKVSITDSLCIVCKKPETDFEVNYIKEVINCGLSKNIQVFTEHNDTITDYYIMKEAELLICSKSTLSWCAAFFSDKLNKCYVPDYEISPGQTFKYPIDNTELY